MPESKCKRSEARALLLVPPRLGSVHTSKAPCPARVSPHWHADNHTHTRGPLVASAALHCA